MPGVAWLVALVVVGGFPVRGACAASGNLRRSVRLLCSHSRAMAQVMPLSAAPEPKRRFIPSKWEEKK